MARASGGGVDGLDIWSRLTRRENEGKAAERRKEAGEGFSEAARGEGWKVERKAGRGQEKTQWSKEEEEEKDTRAKAKEERDTQGRASCSPSRPPPRLRGEARRDFSALWLRAEGTGGVRGLAGRFGGVRGEDPSIFA